MSYSEFKNTERNWSNLTEKGNLLYQQGEHNAALQFYQQALFFSESMIRNVEDAENLNIQIASPFFVSCLNIANNYWIIGDLKKAGEYFFYNVWHLKMLSMRDGISPAMYQQAIKNWEKAILTLVDFHDKTNQPLKVDFLKDETYEMIKQTRAKLVNKQIHLN